MNKSNLVDGIERGFGRFESIKNRAGKEIGRDPLPELIKVECMDAGEDGTLAPAVHIYARTENGKLLFVRDEDAIGDALAEFASAEVRKRTAAATDIANGRAPK